MIKPFSFFLITIFSLSVSAYSAPTNNYSSKNAKSPSDLTADQWSKFNDLADQVDKKISRCLYNKLGARGYLKFMKDNKMFQEIMGAMCSEDASLLAGSAQDAADDYARSDNGKILADCKGEAIDDFYDPRVTEIFSYMSPIYGILDNKGHPIDLCDQFRKNYEIVFYTSFYWLVCRVCFGPGAVQHPQHNA